MREGGEEESRREQERRNSSFLSSMSRSMCPTEMVTLRFSFGLEEGGGEKSEYVYV